MRDVIFTTAYKRDLKRVTKRGCDISKIDDIAAMLCDMQPLLPAQHDHKLTGDYEGWRECHIEPDWLLIYRVDKITDNVVLYRTGTHTDLFK